MLSMPSNGPLCTVLSKFGTGGEFANRREGHDRYGYNRELFGYGHLKKVWAYGFDYPIEGGLVFGLRRHLTGLRRSEENHLVHRVRQQR